MHSVPMRRNAHIFKTALKFILDLYPHAKVAGTVDKFASQHLDLEKTCSDFVRQVEQLTLR